MSQHQNFDTTLTKIYVGGLPWATREEGLIRFFQQFGEIIHANVVCERATGRSQGYGFVTFKYAESATRACEYPNPTIDGRMANCKLASDGANINHNQCYLIPLGHDDLCFTSPSLWQNLQPLTTYEPPHYWNPIYPQYPQECYNYSQHYPQYPQQCESYPQYPQYPQQSYEHYPMVDTNQWYYWPHQLTNGVNGESSSRRPSTRTAHTV